MADLLIIPSVLVGKVSDSRFERGSSSRSRLARHVRSSRPSCPVSSFTGSISPSGDGGGSYVFGRRSATGRRCRTACLKGPCREGADTSEGYSSLHAWLYRHAFHPASRLARSERRRAKRETNYATTAMDETDANADGLSDILPRLLLGLSASDRDLVITRFFEQLSIRTIDETRSISEDTAQKRVSRALERLRKELAAMGITSSMALHADLLARQWVPPPLPALFARILSKCQPSMVTGSTSFLGIGGSR